MQSARPSASGGGGGSSNQHCSTPTPKGYGGGVGASRFGFQTPPPGSGGKPPPVDPSNGQGTEFSPTSFSGMINRFFASNPGAEIDAPVADADGEVREAPPAPPTAVASGVTHSPPRSASAGGERVSPARLSGTGATAAAAAAAAAAVAAKTGSPSGVSSRPPAMAAASSPPRRRAPSSPCPKTQVSADYSAGGGSQRARSAGYSGGGIERGTVREEGRSSQERGAGGKNVPENAPGMFSDDESESDAGRSSDTDRDDSFGGGIDNPAASGDIGRSGSGDGAEKTEVGARGSGRVGVAGLFEGRDRLDGKQHSNGSPVRRSGGAGAPSTPPGVTLRNRAVSPRDVAAAATGGIGGETEGGEAIAAATGEPSWAVLVERCYVMVSCHRNHPLMFKVRLACCVRCAAKVSPCFSIFPCALSRLDRVPVPPPFSRK